MEIIRHIGYYYGVNTYFVKNNGHAIIIDPAVTSQVINHELEGLILDGVILTHGHFDHLTSLKYILDNYESPVYAHQTAFELMEDPHKNASDTEIPFSVSVNRDRRRYLNDQDTISLIGKEVHIITTPGHTACGICIEIDDSMFTGDTIFKDAIGRYDMPTASGSMLRNSLRKLASIEKNYTIYPGHGDASTLFNETKRYLKK